MFRRIVSLKSSVLFEVRVAMAYNKQDRGRKRNNRQDNRSECVWFPNPNAKPFDGNRERHMEPTKGFPRSEDSKDNGIQGGQFNNDGSDYNSGKPWPPGSYPYNENICYGRSQSRDHRSNNREWAQQNQYHRDLNKVGWDPSHQQRLQPDPYQSDSQKGHGQQAQSGSIQSDSKKGDMVQRNSMQGHVDQDYIQWAKPDSFQGDSQDDDDDDIFLSKMLSFLIKYEAEKQNFKLMPGGFLYMDEIMQKMRKLESVSVEDVLRIVVQNDKQRFAIQMEDGTGRLKILVKQGHSVEVEDLELTQITSADQVPMVLHGTYHDAWKSIKKQGLCRFKRNHIHFAAGQPGDNGVISGMRSSCEVMIFIDLEKALKDGLKFYLSANNVILSPGNEEGYIYPCYFDKVVNRYPYHILEFDLSIKGKKTASADQIPNELEKKKKMNKKKNKEDRENNESGALGEAFEGNGDIVLLAGLGEKLKEMNIEEMDEDHNVDTIETEPERFMQSHVSDQWDDADKVVQDQKAWINSKGVEQSEGKQGLAESEDAKGAKEMKTKKKESLYDTSKGALKSNAQSMSQALKRATKPETAKGSVIPKSEQKGTFTPEDEDEGAATEVTADGEDVKVEEEWTTVSITNVEESQSAVEYILEQNEPVTIICCGEKQGDADGKITLLLISMQNKTWIYQLCSMEGNVMEAGKLKQLFFDLNLMKVFHGVAWQSAVLFRQFDIVLDGTKVFDSKVVCQQNLIDDKAMKTLRLGGFMPSRWIKEDGKIESSKWTQNPLDSELVNKLIERCKALLLFYEMFPILPNVDILLRDHSKGTDMAYPDNYLQLLMVDHRGGMKTLYFYW